VGCGPQAVVQEGEFSPRVDGGDIEQIETAIGELAPRCRGPIGDPLHFFQEFGGIAAEEQGVDQATGIVPGGLRVPMAADLGHHRDIPGDLVGEQLPMLPAPLVGGPLDVHHQPAILRVAPGRSAAADSNRFGDRIGMPVHPGFLRCEGLPLQEVTRSAEQDANPSSQPPPVSGAQKIPTADPSRSGLGPSSLTAPGVDPCGGLSQRSAVPVVFAASK
jgi:hypothetical protein